MGRSDGAWSLRAYVRMFGPANPTTQLELQVGAMTFLSIASVRAAEIGRCLLRDATLSSAWLLDFMLYCSGRWG